MDAGRAEAGPPVLAAYAIPFTGGALLLFTVQFFFLKYATDVLLLAPGFPDWVKGAALAIVTVNEFLWFGLVASLFSTARARRAYGRAKVWIDRAAGTCLALLGIRLALSER